MAWSEDDKSMSQMLVASQGSSFVHVRNAYMLVLYFATEGLRGRHQSRISPAEPFGLQRGGTLVLPTSFSIADVARLFSLQV